MALSERVEGGVESGVVTADTSDRRPLSFFGSFLLFHGF